MVRVTEKQDSIGFVVERVFLKKNVDCTDFLPGWIIKIREEIQIRRDMRIAGLQYLPAEVIRHAFMVVSDMEHAQGFAPLMP
jgi:hypothetical protein